MARAAECAVNVAPARTGRQAIQRLSRQDGNVDGRGEIAAGIWLRYEVVRAQYGVRTT